MQETKKVSIQDVMEEKDQQQKAEKYNQYIKQVTQLYEECCKGISNRWNHMPNWSMLSGVVWQYGGK